MKHRSLQAAEAKAIADHALEQRDHAEARLACVVDALASLVRSFPELSGSFTSHEQQSALRAARALLAEHGR